MGAPSVTGAFIVEGWRGAGPGRDSFRRGTEHCGGPHPLHRPSRLSNCCRYRKLSNSAPTDGLVRRTPPVADGALRRV